MTAVMGNSIPRSRTARSGCSTKAYTASDAAQASHGAACRHTQNCHAAGKPGGIVAPEERLAALIRRLDQRGCSIRKNT